MLVTIYQGASADPAIWQRLWRLGRLQALLGNTLLLTTLVTLGALVLGVALAWLVERTRLPGQRWWSPLLCVPLVIPSYLLAIAYESLMGPWGLLADVFKVQGWAELAATLPNASGLGGASLMLILGTYPYVYLLTRASFRGVNPALEDAARTCGLKPWSVFWKVTLPLIRPALIASALLVAVTTIADFGAVARMKYSTLTTAVYDQLTTRFDRSTAAALSTVLIIGVLILLWAQLRLWGRGQHYYRTNRSSAEQLDLNRWRWPAIIGLALVWMTAFLMPTIVFAYWMIQGWLQPSDVQSIWGTGWLDLLRYAWHGFFSAGLTATLALFLAIPMAYLAVRHQAHRWGNRFAWLAQVGFALPGVLVALGLAFVLHRYVPVLYFSVAALVIAYLVLFFPLGFQAIESGLAQVPQHLEDSARMLRQRTLSIWRRVTLPLLAPTLAAGWMLVFTNALRELPATLLLRPPGFDTLPVRIWIATGEGFLTQAAPAALLLILLSVPLSFLLAPEKPLKDDPDG
jgi:iron(III) transport system permease protein